MKQTCFMMPGTWLIFAVLSSITVYSRTKITTYNLLVLIAFSRMVATAESSQHISDEKWDDIDMKVRTTRSSYVLIFNQCADKKLAENK